MQYAEIHSVLELALKAFPSFSEKYSGVWEGEIDIQIRQSFIKRSHTLSEFCSIRLYFGETVALKTTQWEQLDSEQDDQKP